MFKFCGEKEFEMAAMMVGKIKMKARHILFVCLFTALQAGAAHAQLDTSKLEVGARQMGMGSAAVGEASDINAMYWNPAGLIQLSGTYIATMRQVLFQPLNIPYDYLAFARKLPSGDAYGVYLSRMDASGELGFSWKEDKYFFSYAYDFEDEEGLSIGLNAKYYRTVAVWAGGNGKGDGYGADLGILYRVSPQLKLGLMARDVYTQMKWSTGTKETFPATYVLGLAYEAKNDTNLVFDTEYDTNKSIPGPFRMHIGFEKWLDEVIALRAGYTLSQTKDESSPTAGIGVHLGPWQIDYAYIHKPYSLSGVEPAHRISATYKIR